MREIATQLIDSGEVTRGFLGIVIQPLSADLARAFGLEQTRGVLIAQVSRDSPAERAGLRQGDVIVAYRGEPVTDVGSFRNSVALTRPGRREQLTILRKGKRRTVEVRVGRLSAEQPIAAAPAVPARAVATSYASSLRGLRGRPARTMRRLPAAVVSVVSRFGAARRGGASSRSRSRS